MRSRRRQPSLFEAASPSHAHAHVPCSTFRAYQVLDNGRVGAEEAAGIEEGGEAAEAEAREAFVAVEGGAAAAAAAAAAEEEEEEEDEEEEDHVLAAEAYAAQLTSYEVLEWELAKLQGDTLDEAAEARRDGEWPPMHSAPALPFALGRPPVGRCVASAKVPPCATPTASARLGRTAIHSSTCIRMCTACSLHMHHMPAACAPQRSRRARFSSSSR